jgi:transposase-like protein
MAKKRKPKISTERFIQAVMHAKNMSDVARELGTTRQAVSKRLRQYRERGIVGLPKFDGRAVSNDELQRLVDQQQQAALTKRR